MCFNNTHMYLQHHNYLKHTVYAVRIIVSGQSKSVTCVSINTFQKRQIFVDYLFIYFRIRSQWLIYNIRGTKYVYTLMCYLHAYYTFLSNKNNLLFVNCDSNQSSLNCKRYNVIIIIHTRFKHDYMNKKIIYLYWWMR